MATKQLESYQQFGIINEALDMVGKADMKKEYYVDNISTHDIIRIEENLYKLYRDAILDFEKSFSLYKCNIEIIDGWTTGDSGEATNIRPNLENKYIYWICYVVLYNGKPIVYDDENSPMTRSYGVLTISKKKRHQRQHVFVRIFDDTEDVVEELAEDLSRIKQMFAYPSGNTGDGSLF